jgi:hypothetical protein
MPTPKEVRHYNHEERSTEEPDYGDVMRFLLFFRDRYSSDEEFGKFLIDSLQKLVYDLREFEVYISISPDSVRRAQGHAPNGQS